MEMHKIAVHTKKEEVKETKKKGRKNKRAEAKPPKFLEREMREEFRRKQAEFKSYSERTSLEGEKIADDLYLACEMPLKRRLLASSKINNESFKKTDPEVIISEMERICLPKLNVIVDRQQFKRLEQDKNESINSFESRVRFKAILCGYN